MSSKQEYVEVTVKVPKAAYEFLKKWMALIGEDVEKFLESTIRSEISSMLDAEVFDGPWSSREQIVKAHGLEKFLDC